MKKYIMTGIAATVFVTGCANTSMNNTKRGAVSGAVAGGLVGGIAGNNTHRFIARPVASKTGAGILVGAVGGGVIGALVGYAQDQKIRADKAIAASASK